MSSSNGLNKTIENELILPESAQHEYDIGGTHFILTSHFKPNAKESLIDKISRMIRNDAGKNKEPS